MLFTGAGDPVYERVARRAIQQLWAMRSDLNLLGTTLDMRNATWLSTSGGIGASADSFYEYALKGYLLFGESLVVGEGPHLQPLSHTATDPQPRAPTQATWSYIASSRTLTWCVVPRCVKAATCPPATGCHCLVA